MKKVVYITNLPSPYRVDFFNELGKYCDLTVVYERLSSLERNTKWKGESAINFTEVYSNSKPVGIDKSSGNKIKRIVKNMIYDILVITGYSSPSVIKLIMYCKIHKIPFYVEYDGGFNKKDNIFLRFTKKFLLNKAKGHLTTSDEHINYLISLGISQNKIFKYPFSSVSKKDIEIFLEKAKKGKLFYKEKLGIEEEKMVLSVGRFSYQKGYGKGFDVLLDISGYIDDSAGIYIVGDDPTPEFISRKETQKLENIKFIGFKTKEELAEYYLAADVFVLLTRGDVWGLVINEAMAYGVPVITTKRCLAGTELVYNGDNGFIVDIDNHKEIIERLNYILKNEKKRHELSNNASSLIMKYTIESMANKHKEVFDLDDKTV